MAGAQPIPNISAETVTTLLPSSGLRRGVVVLNHGLHGGTNTAPPYAIADVLSTAIPALNLYYLTLANLLTADGWIVIQPPQVGDQYESTQALGIQADITGDSGGGTRLMDENLMWGEYVDCFIVKEWGNVPTVYFGMSWGAYLTLILASTAPQLMVAYGVHCPPTILANLNLAALGGPSWAALGHGADILTTNLNGITMPGIIGYGTNDNIVGYNSAGTGGTPVSNTDALITAAQTFNGSIRKPVRNSTTDGHGLLLADTQTYANASTGWFATDVDPICPKFF